MIAGALSRNRLNILGAQIYTSTDGFAVDTLQVETAAGTPITDDQIWRQVEADLRAALAGTLQFDEVFTRRFHSVDQRKLQTFTQPPHIVIDNTISDSYSVIEVQTQDRLGLLYLLTHQLYEQGLDVALAKISTEANRAIDVFYVTDCHGHKIIDGTIVESLQDTLLAALG